MAIALDASAVSTDQTASPLTWNHTCTGSNGLLVVGVYVSSGTPQPTTTAVTYNGVSMTKARADQVTASTAFIETSVWLLKNPATGSNQVSATVSSSGLTPHFGGASTSYTGAQQSSVADAVNGKTGNATGDQTFTVTTKADNAWIFVMGANVAGTTPTMVADQTSRQTLSLASIISSVIRTEDTNAAQTPAGAKTVGMTTGATAAEDGYAMTGVSFGPLISVNVNDTEGTSENINLAQALQINVSDSVTVSDEARFQYNSPAAIYFGGAYFAGAPFVQDINIAIADQITVNDTEATSENIGLLIPTLFITVNDTEATSENIKLNSLSLVTVNDTEGTSENVQLLNIENVNVNDTEATSENVQLLSSTMSVNVNDTEATSENVKLNSIELITVSDSESTSEFVDIARNGSRDVTVSDTEATSEVIMLLDTDGIGVLDSIGTSENVQLQITSFITVNDTEATSENIQLNPVNFVNVSDIESTSENIKLNSLSLINVNDTEATSENVQRLVTNGITVNDTEATSENIQLNPVNFVAVSDTEATSENVQLLNSENVTVSDSTTTSENIAINDVDIEVVADSVVTSENVQLIIASLINVSDSEAISENVVPFIPFLTIIVSDTTVTSENILLNDIELVVDADIVNTAESVQVYVLPLFIDVESLVLVIPAITIPVTVPSGITINMVVS